MGEWDAALYDGKHGFVAEYGKGLLELVPRNGGRAMRLREVQSRDPRLMKRLLDVWERSVQATHLFLSDAEVRRIKGYGRRSWKPWNTWSSPRLKGRSRSGGSGRPA